MNWRTFIFKLVLNRRLSSHMCETYQLLNDEILDLVLERVTIIYRIPYVSCMISAYGIRIMLTMIGKPGMINLFGQNYSNINQYRQQISIRHWNWIIVRISPFLIVVPFADLFLLMFFISLNRPSMWQEILFLGRKWHNACSSIPYVILLQTVLGSFINYIPICEI